jgi:hypothetical protein
MVNNGGILIYSYLFIYGLLDNDVNSSDYMAWNNKTINVQWIGKNMDGYGHCLIYGTTSM